MKMDELVVGERYLAMRYYEPELRDFRSRNFEDRNWERLTRYAICVEVLEKRVTHPSYARPAVKVRLIDPQTEQPMSGREDEEFIDQTFRMVQFISPWAEWAAAYIDHEDEQAERAERRAEERRIENERRQEAAAKRWMEETFARARQDIEQVAEASGLGLFFANDQRVDALVKLRYPNGNPYLNGERSAH